jgi:elongator complex protein 3
MTETYTIIDEILFWVSRDATLFSKEDFHKLKNSILAKYRESEWPSHIEMIERYNMLVRSWQIPDDFRVRRVLRKRAVRSLSGVSVISLLTKFWWCPGKCIYCPTYDNLPKSYISNEPAVQRAEMNDFDPFRQVQNRLQSLSITGNAISKCDVRIIGWTWSVYPEEYKEEFIKQIYDAHTAFGEIWIASELSLNWWHTITGETEGDKLSETDDKQYNWWAKANEFLSPSEPFVSFQLWKESKTFGTFSHESMEEKTKKSSPFARSAVPDNSHFIPSKTLEEAKIRNETAMSRVIGMAIETRPDWIDEIEIRNLRRYGVTRVEIGYQTTDDRINEINKRWHWNRESIRATGLLKDAGFKVVAHMMPGLVGATPEWDIASMREIFENPLFRPDELKIYPLVVTPNSELTKIWERWEFIPYDDTTLIPLMAELQW